MFSYGQEALNEIFSEYNDGVVAMAKCNCTACNSCSCGRCYDNSCISQCTGCRWRSSNPVSWDEI